MTRPRFFALRLALATALLSGGALASHAQQLQLDWQSTPATAPLGPDLAEIELPAGYVFLDGEGTRQLLELLENPVDGSEVGVVTPVAENQNWLLVFEYEATGYVPDTDADSLDADAMLSSIREGTERANQERVRRGWSPMEIHDWHEAPHYDARTHNLTWAILGGSNGERTVNKLVKLLGRQGVMTATLVSSPEDLVVASAQVDDLLAGYHFRPGNTYAEYVPGHDRVAEFGLAALVVGGAGAALVKSGLLARFWKVIVAGSVGLLSVMRRMFGTRRAEDEPITEV